MNAKHRKTLAAIFSRPTSASIVFADIEALIKALGGSISEREGSHVKIELKANSGGAIGHIRERKLSVIKRKRRGNCWNVQECCYEHHDIQGLYRSR